MMLRHHKSETAQNKFPKFETKFQVLKLNPSYKESVKTLKDRPADVEIIQNLNMLTKKYKKII